jgi:monoamine oxidase
LRGVRVIAVGAGLAGLVAARELRGKGASVRILEARDGPSEIEPLRSMR